MDEKIILIAEEYPSHSGGVAYFSDVLAKKYTKEGRLKGVISLSEYKPATRNFAIVHIQLPSRNYGKYPFDDFLIFRKLNSLFLRVWWRISGSRWKPVKKALKTLLYNPKQDILFFTYHVHYPGLFKRIHKRFQGNQWILYHGLDLLGFKDYPKPVIETTRIAEKVIFNSKATQRLFQDLGFSAKSAEVIHPFLDVEYLQSLDLLSKEKLETNLGIEFGDKLLITSICRLIRRKGIHFAIEIVEHLINKGVRVVYLIGGNGPEYESLKSLAEEKNLINHIHFLGYVDDVIKYSIFSESEIFLMPNYDDGGADFEGFGISFLEADYYNNMIIGGSHGGAVEALEFCKNAKFFHFPEELNQAMVYLDKFK
ncbi:MAG: glycosyltransferase [Fulvivirga sp.]|uniref:glycosyltransferase family 4 protein n=1 Tax=Fulvivirga sp. TaxID=1931237 RepID=UPI0032EB97E4